MSPMVPASEPSFVTRLGLALAAPRWALAIAGDRRNPGRPGNDLVRVIGLGLVAGYVQVIVVAAWLSISLGTVQLSALASVVASALIAPMAALVVAAGGLWLSAGKARSLGRAFDLACVSAVPLMLVLMVSSAVAAVTSLGGSPVWQLVVLGAAFGWFGAVIALALPVARISASVAAVPPEAVATRGRRAGRGVLLGLAALVAAQLGWIVWDLDAVRPVLPARPAPAFALPQVGAQGALGARWELPQEGPGRVVVLDFWATWCGVCVKGMPQMEHLRRTRPEVEFVAINLDDAKQAREFFDKSGFGLRLLFDDSEVAARYGVTSLPHAVVIDPRGVVHKVFRGHPSGLAAVLDSLRDAPAAPTTR